MDRDQILSDAEGLGLRWGRPDGVMVSRAAVVAEARSWLGTPFMHQGERKGVGVDCSGLIRGVCVELGLIPSNYLQYVPEQVRGYAANPDRLLGLKLCDLWWNRVDLAAMQPGDIAVTRWPSDERAQHISIVGDYVYGGLTLIHAANRYGKVIEHRWLSSADPRSPQLAAAYSIPGVE